MSGPGFTYKELLSVALELPYYSNLQGSKNSLSQAPDISISPDAATSDLFSRLDMVMRPLQGGAIILARTLGETMGGDPIMRFPVRKSDKITLLLRLNNPGVLVVNDFPASLDTSKLIYLSNSVIDGAAVRDNLHVSESATGIFGGSDAMTFARNTYRFTNGAPVNSATTFVRHLLTGAEIGCSSCINEGAGASLAFDLSSLPSGICELWIAGVLEETFYHLVDASGLPVFGVVELSLDPATAANYRIVEPDNSLDAQRPRFVVRLVSRDTLWRYTFHMQPTSPLFIELSGMTAPQKATFLSNLNIVTNDPNVSFTAQPSGTDQDLLFVSDTALTLREAYLTPGGNMLSMSLTKNIGDVNAEAIVKKNLPYPSPRLITTNPGPDVYSDIFITI